MGIGWKKKLRVLKREYCLPLAKELVIGNFIQKGDSFSYYLVKFRGKNGLLVVLGKE